MAFNYKKLRELLVAKREQYRKNLQENLPKFRNASSPTKEEIDRYGQISLEEDSKKIAEAVEEWVGREVQPTIEKLQNDVNRLQGRVSELERTNATYRNQIFNLQNPS